MRGVQPFAVFPVSSGSALYDQSSVMPAFMPCRSLTRASHVGPVAVVVVPRVTVDRHAVANLGANINMVAESGLYKHLLLETCAVVGLPILAFDTGNVHQGSCLLTTSQWRSHEIRQCQSLEVSRVQQSAATAVCLNYARPSMLLGLLDV